MGEKKLVAVQLSGGNDYLNCIIPYDNPLYVDNRQHVRVTEDRVLDMGGGLGMNPVMSGIKELYDEGKVAIIHGVGYPDSSRSHFRSMDIWHTAEPTKLGAEGWLGSAINQMYPAKDNVVAAVNFAGLLPRALAAPKAPIASVSDLDTYGLMNHVDNSERDEALLAFKNIYMPAIGSGLVMDYLSQTGLDALKGSGIIKKAREDYKSDVEYADDNFSKQMRAASAIIQAEIGSRILYTQHGTFDSHTNGIALQEGVLANVSTGIRDFYSDIKASNKGDDVIMFVFSEFGRRVKDNGTGTDHGAGGVAFVIGDSVIGGQYGEYPSLEPHKLSIGEDLSFDIDFRSLYTEILEDWLETGAQDIVKGQYEKIGFLRN
tara:strand:+ start:4047 stop:5168 length:1122 start_codon:yes stop_codon:yes gene_type:complete